MPQVEFGSLEFADHYHDEYPDHICPDDDARLKTVTFVGSVPDWLVIQAERDAMDERGECEDTAGQVGLSDAERNTIDFSEGKASVPHARSAKGIARDEGVDIEIMVKEVYEDTQLMDEHSAAVDHRFTRRGWNECRGGFWSTDRVSAAESYHASLVTTACYEERLPLATRRRKTVVRDCSDVELDCETHYIRLA